MIIRTTAPVALLSSLSGNVNSALDYFPGTSLRGVLAFQFRASRDMNNRQNQELFYELFLSDKVRYCNLYPEGASNVFPVPLTARSCKIYSGFKYLHKGFNPEEIEESHGVRDYLINFLLYNIDNKEFPIADECGFDGCPAPVERYSGWCYYSDPPVNEYVESKVSKVEFTRTEILPATQTAKPEILFTTEAIETDQRFEGSIIVNESSLTNELNMLIQDGKLFIGVGKTRGLGAVSIDQRDLHTVNQEAIPVKSHNGIKGRLESLNDVIRNRIKTDNIYFSLTLYSDVIINNSQGQLQTILDIETLKERIESISLKTDVLNKFTLCLMFTNARTISGWSDVWRLPKRKEVAISKGSVFLYESINKINDSEFTELEELLDELEKNPIGKRVNEGFGIVSVCDPFHWRGI